MNPVDDSGALRVSYRLRQLRSWCCPRFFAHVLGAQQLPNPTEVQSPRVGPARGTLVLDGGPKASDVVAHRFVELAGGSKARIVLIPSAAGGAFARDPATVATYRKLFGSGCCVLLHTTDRTMADRAEFATKLSDITNSKFKETSQFQTTM